jgi:hypothetical protein
MSKPYRRDTDEADLDRDDRPLRRPRRKKGGSQAPWIILIVLGSAILALGGVALLVVALSGERSKDKSQQNREAQDDLNRNRERLIGTWTALVQERPRREVTYEFHADGRFGLIISDGAGRGGPSTGTWRAVSARGDTIQVRAESREVNNEMNIEFVSKDRFRYTTPKGFVINASRVR